MLLDMQRINVEAGDTDKAATLSHLVQEYTWNLRTKQYPESKWRAFLEIFGEYNRAHLPVTERHLIAFVR